MRRCGAQTCVEFLDPDEHAAHSRDRVDAEIGTRAVRRDAARLQLERDEALVRDAHLLLRRLAHDRGIGLDPAHNRFRADRSDLLVGDGRHDHVAAQVARARSCEHRRRKRALHVVTAPSIEPPVLHDGVECAARAAEADRVGMRVEEQRGAAAPASRNRDDVRTPRRRVRDLDVESGGTAPVGDETRNRAFAASVRNQIRVRRLDRDERRGELLRLAAYGSTPSSSSEIRSSSASR